MSETARHYCRCCRSKLPAPVENLRNAFCCRGCYRQHYHSRCVVCERKTTRTTGNQRLCGRRKCRNGFEALKAHFALGRYHAPSGRNLIQKTPDFIGPKQPLSPDRPWRVVASQRRTAPPRCVGTRLCDLARSAPGLLVEDPLLEGAVPWRDNWAEHLLI